MLSSTWAHSGTGLLRCSAGPKSGGSSAVTRSALELVAEFGELVAAGHLAGELVEGDIGPLLVQHGLAQLQDDEVVADQVGVVRVVGDEHHAEPGVASGGGVLQHHPGLLDAE